MIDFQFQGNWLVNYDPREQKYPDILIILAQIQDYFEKKKIKFNSINIIFDKNSDKNYFYKDKSAIFLTFIGINAEFSENNLKNGKKATFSLLERPIKTIGLLFPRLENDPRWRTMGVPAGHLFLASNLIAGGFKTTPLPLSLPGENGPPEALSADMTGITLFEDLLPLLRPFLADFRASYKGILAAGGPLPTLAPLSAIYHLPQANLIVRGEAELALPGILLALNKGDARSFFENEGVFWHQSGVVAMAGFDRINRPADFTSLGVDLGFLGAGNLAHGLEMNFSRGCRRGCLFCCQVQGTKLRKLPLNKAEELLKEYRKKVDEFWGSPQPQAGPPPLVRGDNQSKSEASEIQGLINQTPTNCDSSDVPPLSKGGKRGDLVFEQCRSIAPTKSESPRPHSGPPPLVRGVDLTKSATAFYPSCPPLLKGGKRGDFFVEDLKNGHDDRAPTHSRYTVNINDDDILQDPEYAGKIFKLIKAHGFRIFGVQTSIASLIRDDGAPDPGVLNLVADPGLYADSRPLLWLGTDAFLPARARRLGKKLLPADRFHDLLTELEARGLSHFHYWISSDGDSTWGEFVGEFAMLCGYYRDYAGFNLLAHAPFVVPYPASSLFGRQPAGDPRLKIKLALEAPDRRFRYRVVERLETSWPQLNHLLKNDKAGGEKGFFDLLKEKDLMAAAQLAYHFLKQEQLQGAKKDSGLLTAREDLEKVISELIQLSDK